MREAEPSYRPYAVIVPEEAKIVKKIFTLFATGKYSLDTLARKLEADGIKKLTKKRTGKNAGKIVLEPFSKNYLYFMLTNETYLGKVKWHGQTKDFAGDENLAIIDEKLFNKVQAVLKSQTPYYHKKKVKGRYASPLAQITKCSFCGCSITTDFTRNRYGKEYVFIRCTSGKIHRNTHYYEERFGRKTCPQPYNREELVMAEIDKEISKIWIDPNLLAWLEGQLLVVKGTEGKAIGKMIDKLKRERDDVGRKKNRLQDGWEREIISDSTYQESMPELEQRFKEINLEIANLRNQNTGYEQEVEAMVNMVGQLESRWEKLSLEKKCEMLRVMTKEIILGKDGKKNSPTIKWEKPWDMLIAFGAKLEGNKNPLAENWYARRDLNPRLNEEIFSFFFYLFNYIQCIGILMCIDVFNVFHNPIHYPFYPIDIRNVTIGKSIISYYSWEQNKHYANCCGWIIIFIFINHILNISCG